MNEKEVNEDATSSLEEGVAIYEDRYPVSSDTNIQSTKFRRVGGSRRLTINQLLDGIGIPA